VKPQKKSGNTKNDYKSTQIFSKSKLSKNLFESIGDHRKVFNIDVIKFIASSNKEITCAIVKQNACYNHQKNHFDTLVIFV